MCLLHSEKVEQGEVAVDQKSRRSSFVEGLRRLYWKYPALVISAVSAALFQIRRPVAES